MQKILLRPTDHLKLKNNFQLLYLRPLLTPITITLAWLNTFCLIISIFAAVFTCNYSGINWLSMQTELYCINLSKYVNKSYCTCLLFYHCFVWKNCSRVSKSSTWLGGPMVECLTRDTEAAGSSLTSVTALCFLARHINPSLVLVQPRKTEILLMGHKNHMKKQNQ